MPTPSPTQTLLTALQLGQLLKAARKRRKLTQSAVAARLGLSQNRVSHLELHPEELSCWRQFKIDHLGVRTKTWTTRR